MQPFSPTYSTNIQPKGGKARGEEMFKKKIQDEQKTQGQATK